MQNMLSLVHNLSDNELEKNSLLNPLTLEINPSGQRCLPECFTGDLKF